jgi:subtilisin family serine protease
MIARAPDRPFCPERSRTTLRGQLLVRVAAGEAPPHIPAQRDVRRAQAPAASFIDGGPLDRTLRRFSPAMRVTRAFSAASTLGGATGGHKHWDDMEEDLGLSRTFRVAVDPEASLVALVDALAELDLVEEVSPNYLSVTPFAGVSPGAGENADPWYGHRMIGVEQALAFEPGDRTAIVGVVDSGVALGHPELADRLRPGVDTVDLAPENFSRDVSFVGDTQTPDRIPSDEIGHGTACASIIAGRGVDLPKGLASAGFVLPVRVLAGARLRDRAALTALGSIADIDEGVKAAVDLGARVLNLSFGTPESALRGNDPRPHSAVVAYARRRGCILVAASGNSGREDRYYPACLDGVVAVGAVGPDGIPSSFSSRGDHVDLCAPGENIPAAGLSGSQRCTGTSFAAPFVAGACALLVARAARYSRPIGADVARDLLSRTARPFPRSADARGCGGGILDVPKALRALDLALSSNDPMDFTWRPTSPRRDGPEAAVS